MDLKTLTCPSCGGELHLPSDLRVAHCIYCSKQIMLPETRAAHEQQTIERYMELCRVALDAKNFGEAFRYASQVLELDPKNVDAWLNKAVAAFGLQTEQNDRFQEVRQYLSKASEISPNDERITQRTTYLRTLQTNWYCELAKQAWWRGMDAATVSSIKQGRVESIGYYLKALRCWPSTDQCVKFRLSILEVIENEVSSFVWSDIPRPDAVSTALRELEAIRRRKDDVGELSRLRVQLTSVKSDLSSVDATLTKLRRKGGFRVKKKITEAENQARVLKAKIAEIERKITKYERLVYGD